MNGSFDVIDYIYREADLAILSEGLITARTENCHFVYGANGFFPEEIQMSISHTSKLTLTQDEGTGERKHIGETNVKLAVGMVGTLKPYSPGLMLSAMVSGNGSNITIVPVPHPRQLSENPEEFIVEVTSVDADGRNIIVRVEQPTNVPICEDRWSIQSNFRRQQIATDVQFNPASWAFLKTVVGLEIPEDFQLSNDLSLVKLTTADVSELRQYLLTTYRALIPISDPLTHALCFRGESPNVQGEFNKILTALRLFKAGYLALNLDFYFAQGQGGGSIHDDPLYRADYAKFSLHETEFSDVRHWINYYRLIDIHPESVMAAALRRFAQTYSGELTDRITDAVIGLEGLVCHTNAPEIRYRVGQRVAFLLTDHPTARINLDLARALKNSYEARSADVHGNPAVSKTVNEVLALKSQDWLRNCIKRILHPSTPIELREVFCQPSASQRKEGFYEALVSFGSFKAAADHWVKTQKQPQSSKTQKKRTQTEAPPTNVGT
jgi:hypothetical protein